METLTNNIFSNSIIYSLHTEKQTEYDNLLLESVLLFQLSGEMTFETSSDKVTTQPGEIHLVRKNQFIKTIKKPNNNEDYKALMFVLKENVLRDYAFEKHLETEMKYYGKPNIQLPKIDYLKGFFDSLIPYVQNPKNNNHPLSELKVREAIELLINLAPELRFFLFDFSEPHKIDLEKFMHTNFKFNVPLDSFARLTGRSLAGFKRDFGKIFNSPPRTWLQHKRLTEAHFQISRNDKTSSSIYVELGFESLSHFTYAYRKEFGYTPKATPKFTDNKITSEYVLAIKV